METKKESCKEHMAFRPATSNWLTEDKIDRLDQRYNGHRFWEGIRNIVVVIILAGMLFVSFQYIAGKANSLINSARQKQTQQLNDAQSQYK